MRTAKVHIDLQDKNGKSARSSGGYPAFRDPILSSFDDQIALLDKHGNIVAVNKAWKQFWRENAGTGGAPQAGTNYLEVCRRSEIACPEVKEVLTGIQGVTNRSVPKFQWVYSCHSAREQRWFSMNVTPLVTADGGVVVSHRDITSPQLTEGLVAGFLDSVSAILWRANADTFQTTYASKQAEEILGYPAARFVRERGFWMDRIHPEDRKRVITFTSKAVREGRHHDFEYRMNAADGRTVWLRNIVNVVSKEGKPAELIGVTVDITERKKAEAMIRETEERFQLMADTVPVMIWMSDPDKLCTYFNKVWLEFTGRSMQQELGNGWTESVHPEDLRRCMETYAAAFDRREKFAMEYRLRRFDGEYRWILDCGAPRYLDGSGFAGYVGGCVDITDRKAAEAERAELNRRLVMVQEEERRRVARDLHDDISQRLALLAIGLQQLSGRSSASRGDRSEIERLWSQTNDIAGDIQRLAHQLHSSKLQHLGLTAAIQGLCSEFSKQIDIDVKCNVNALPASLAGDAALGLFRVAQEAFRNVAKHSHATRVRAELLHRKGEVLLRVSDDGVGFDSATVGPRAGLGLISMKERMRLLGGELTISSYRSAGTTLEARVRLHQCAGVPPTGERPPRAPRKRSSHRGSRNA